MSSPPVKRVFFLRRPAYVKIRWILLPLPLAFAYRLQKDTSRDGAFAERSTIELLRAQTVYQLCQYPWFIDQGARLLASIENIGGPLHSLTLAVVRATFFRTFCAGETTEQSVTTVQSLAKHGIGTILSYSAEEISGAGPEQFEAVTDEYIRAIETLAGGNDRNFVAVKPTGLTEMSVLQALNSALEKQGPGHTLLELFRHDQVLAGYHNQALCHFLRRVHRICAMAKARKVAVAWDAEYSSCRTALDTVYRSLAEQFNGEESVIMNTHQAYYTDSAQSVMAHLSHARRCGYVPSCKLVRGAYLELERRLAEESRRPSPIWSSKPETDKSYDECLDIIADDLTSYGSGTLMAATHNEASARKALLSRAGPRVLFAQLYGMADDLSFRLASHARVYKYVPYGPVDRVIPYLVRRAQENKAVLNSKDRVGELRLVRSELMRRASYALGLT